jgi:hypothetical protein
MIPTGKDLVVYKMNRLARFAFMAVATLTFTAFMMLMCVAFG